MEPGLPEDDVVGLQAALDAESADEAGGDDAAADGQDVGDLAADYIEELLDICDLDGDLEIEEAGDRVVVKVTGGDLRLLGAPETVGALQELTRLAVQTSTGGFAKLTLDIGGSRDTRSRQLGELVARAEKALLEGDAAYPLQPMSSYERKLVHDLAAERGLQSHSEGEGAGRHIVLTSA
ncbi:protein jag [Amnibacterium endophyticum]|uniref:Protein jag n=1 Tax=Amnibacterium endophyticum TaxID=2109337 RepID=A0ABW4LBV5_9MICO